MAFLCGWSDHSCPGHRPYNQRASSGAWFLRCPPLRSVADVRSDNRFLGDHSGALIVLLTAIGMRRWPKIGVYINMLAIGVFIDIFNWLIPDVEGWFAHSLIFALGLFVMAFGV